MHPTAPHYTPLHSPTAHCTPFILLHPPVPHCPPLPWDLTFPASTSSPVSASYSGMVTLQGKEGAEPGAPIGAAP